MDITTLNTSRCSTLIVEIKDDLHKKLKIEAVEQGITLRQLVIALLEYNQKGET